MRWLSAILHLDSSLYKTVDYVLEVLTKFVSDKWVAYRVFMEQQVVSEVIYYSNTLFNQHNSYFGRHWPVVDLFVQGQGNNGHMVKLIILLIQN